jgi:hypothetical protein
MDYQTDISRFVAGARGFCTWIEGTPGPNEVFEATRLVSRLHADAVMLPEVDDEHLPEGDDIPEIPAAQKQAAAGRFKGFPFQYYWEIFSPITEKPDEPVCGDIADDFSDIYLDVKAGLLAYDLGRQHQAVWHWRFTWGMHWGEHATSALRALHSHQKNGE